MILTFKQFSALQEETVANLLQKKAEKVFSFLNNWGYPASFIHKVLTKIDPMDEDQIMKELDNLSVHISSSSNAPGFNYENLLRFRKKYPEIFSPNTSGKSSAFRGIPVHITISYGKDTNRIILGARTNFDGLIGEAVFYAPELFSHETKIGGVSYYSIPVFPYTSKSTNESWTVDENKAWQFSNNGSKLKSSQITNYTNEITKNMDLAFQERSKKIQIIIPVILERHIRKTDPFFFDPNFTSHIADKKFNTKEYEIIKIDGSTVKKFDCVLWVPAKIIDSIINKKEKLKTVKYDPTTTFDFADRSGPVPAHQHPNGGGWVADTASVADTAFVGPDARVFGSAEVSGNAWVHGNAHVSGKARVSENALVFGSAEVSGNAWVHGNAHVSGKARVSENALVSGDARVFGDAQVFGKAMVSENAWVLGDAQVYGNAQVSENARVYGNARVFGDAWVLGDAHVYGNARVHGNALVYGKAWVYGNARVSGKAQVYGDARITQNLSTGQHSI